MSKNKSKKKTLGYLGCDVSKGICNFVLENKKGEEIEANFQLDDNRDGHNKLYELIKGWKEEKGLTKIIVGVESTGGYENNWYNGLRRKSKELGLEVFRINPKLIYHETKKDGHRSITDGVSAKVIAGYLRKNYGEKNLSSERLKSSNGYTDNFSGMKNLHKYIQRLIKQKTRSMNALEKLLYSTMPEILSIKGTKYPNWFLSLLIKHPSRKDILSADNEGLISIPHLTQTKANLIHVELEDSVGEKGDEYSSLSIRELATDIQQLKKKINRTRKEFLKLAKKEKGLKKNIEIITSINGIAEDTAIGCLIELGKVSRFEKAKNVVAYWGINPTFKQSGDKKYRAKMSKDGSSSARSVMYIAATNVVRHEVYFSNVYHSQRRKGKSHYSAIGVVMSKLTRIIYGMLKSGKPFESSIDLENQKKVSNKNSKKKNQVKEDKSLGSKSERRYQDKQKKAPLSMTQRVRRKQEQSVPS